MARHLALLCLVLFVVNFSVGLPVDETKATDGETVPGDGIDETDPGEYGDLTEGDIMVPKYKRNGNPNLSQRWPNGVVPYIIDWSVGSTGRSQLEKAFKYYQDNTCIRLVQRTSQTDYVVFKSPSSGCNSYIGKIGGAQTINLADSCFNALGTVLHEIMHAIGFNHEMGREDRDQYINIHWNNIQDAFKSAFNIHKGTLTYGTRYDISSVMQYSSKAFSKNGQYTITPKNGDPSQLGQRSKLTATDLAKVSAMYSCSGTGMGTATTKSPVSSSCKNEHEACDYWASYGECTKNPGYMLAKCKKACSVCTAVSCVDQNSSCPGWASRNPSECQVNPNYMLKYCKKSCRVC